MKINSLFYLTIQGIKNLWINRLMTLASIAVLTTCLLLVGFAILFTINVNNIVLYVEQQNEIVVFVKDDATQIELEDLSKYILNHQNVSSYEYISKDEALQIEKDRYGDQSELLSGLEEDNPLPASFNVRITNLELLSETVNEISSQTAVDQINATTEVSNAIVTIKDIVNSIGSAVVIALTIVSLIIISNTIRASVFFRRKEINIMKYVGATNGFIKFPFLIEGVILGLIASGISLLITWGGYTAFVQISDTSGTNFLSSVFSVILPFESVFVAILVSYGVSGIVIGSLGSFFSIRSHLKV